MIAYLGDCSRYVPATEPYSEATTDNVLTLTDCALSHGRTSGQVLGDHGPRFCSDDPESRFTSYLESHGIQHITGSIEKPTAQGKIERLFQTFPLYCPKLNDLDQFIEYYNKPHRSPSFKTPTQRALN